MDTFNASVQYNDLKGRVAADDADEIDAGKWLENNGLINPDESLVGIRMWAGENHGTHEDPVSVRFLVATLDGHENFPAKLNSTGEPIQVRDVRVDMNIADFLALFKRFEITLSPMDMIDGISYTTD